MLLIIILVTLDGRLEVLLETIKLIRLSGDGKRDQEIIRRIVEKTQNLLLVNDTLNGLAKYILFFHNFANIYPACTYLIILDEVSSISMHCTILNTSRNLEIL